MGLTYPEFHRETLTWFSLPATGSSAGQPQGRGCCRRSGPGCYTAQGGMDCLAIAMRERVPAWSHATVAARLTIAGFGLGF
jgi:hypothetical protein